MLSEVTCEQQKLVTLWNDNQSTQKLSINSVFYKRIKHIDIRYHFIRQAIDEKQIGLKYMPMKNMVADILNKKIGGQISEMCSK